MVSGMIQRLLVVVGITLVTAVLIVGFGVSVYAGDSDCGSAFVDKSASAEIADTFEGGSGQLGCDGARSEARALPMVLLVIGVGLGVGSALVRNERPALTVSQSSR